MWPINFSQSLFRFIIQDVDEDVCSVLSFKSQLYGIGQSYIFDVVIKSKERLDRCHPPLYKRKAYLEWEYNDKAQFIHGGVLRLKTFLEHQDDFIYEIRLVSPLWELIDSKESQTFVHQNANEIVDEMLSEFLNQHEYTSKLSKQYKRISFIAQHQLMNFVFLKYLCSRYGLWFLFEQQPLFARLCFYDDVNDLKYEEQTISFQEADGLVLEEGVVFSLAQKISIYPKIVTIRDYNPEKSELNLCGEASYFGQYSSQGNKEYYGLGVDDVSEAEVLAKQILGGFNCRREITIIKTNHLGLMLGQVIHLSNHPIQTCNKAYRIITIKHQANQSARGMRYYNTCYLIPAALPFCLSYFDLPPLNFLVIAKTIGLQDGSPNLDDQGRYQVQFNFDSKKRVSSRIRRTQLYGGPTKQFVYGSHFPLRGGVDVGVGFEDGKPHRPVILGVMPNEILPPPVTGKNASQYRLRTYSGNELVLDDQEDNESINLHTAKEDQALLLSSKRGEEQIALINRIGEMHINSGKNIEISAQKNAMAFVKKDQLVNVTKDYQSGSEFQKIEAGENLIVSADNQLSIETEEGDVSIHGSDEILINSNETISIDSNSQDVLITANELSITAPEISFVCPGKIDIASSLSIQNGNVNFSNASFMAPSITKQPPASTKNANSKQGQSKTLAHQTKKREQEKDKLFPLIAINCRGDAVNRSYFKSEHKANDPYCSNGKSVRLTAKQLQYFATSHIPKIPAPNQRKNPPNVTIFIHGYNVMCGEFGQPITVSKEKEKCFKNRFFSRLDVCRDSALLNRIAWDYPDAKIKKELINPGLQIIHQEDMAHVPKKELDAAASVGVTDAMVNGEGAHNWWLYMERNLNLATKQLDEKHYANYTRFLHIAWQGNPASPLDYMAAVARATQTASSLVALIKQLHRQGLEINIIAHSLGCQLVLKLMDLLGGDNSLKESLNCVFLWQAAIPNNVFSSQLPESPEDKYLDHTVYSAPNASKAAKKIIALYTHNDNILGPVPPGEELQFWRKLFHPAGGVSIALLVGAIHLIDCQKIPRHLQSVYHVAHIFGRPFHDFLKSKQVRRDFYYGWIKNHTEKYDKKPFASSLREQAINMRYRFPHCYRYLSILLQGVVDNKIPKALAKAAYLFSKDVDKFEFGPGTRLFHYINEKFIHPPNNQSVNFTPAEELAVLIITVFISEGPMPRPALGYEKPDKKERANSDKISWIDQGDLLGGHSMMKNPSPELLEEIYRKKIFKQKGYHFGAYDSSKDKK